MAKTIFIKQIAASEKFTVFIQKLAIIPVTIVQTVNFFSKIVWRLRTCMGSFSYITLVIE